MSCRYSEPQRSVGLCLPNTSMKMGDKSLIRYLFLEIQKLGKDLPYNSVQIVIYII